MINSNSKPSLSPIQFTKLTHNDIAKHRETYISLFWDDRRATLGEKGKELHKAMQLFYNEFK